MIFHSMYVLLMGGLGLFFIVGWVRVAFEGCRAYSAVKWYLRSCHILGEKFTTYDALSMFLRRWWVFIWSTKTKHPMTKGDGYWRDYDDWELPSPEEGDSCDEPPPTTEYVKRP